MSNTIIGKNTFLDNQIHVAHNVKIGENGIIAGQVGIAGSSVIGKNVKIGGQAGISGHLNVGNNVEIGGGSGVIKDIPDNTRVMGYPAKDLKEFIKEKNECTFVCLDEVSDPRNIGSLIRSAASSKIDGLIIKERHFPRDSKLMYKSASGCMEHVNIFQVSNTVSYTHLRAHETR